MVLNLLTIQDSLCAKGTKQRNQSLETNRTDKHVTVNRSNKNHHLSVSVCLVTTLTVVMPVSDCHPIQTLWSPIRTYSTSILGGTHPHLNWNVWGKLKVHNVIEPCISVGRHLCGIVSQLSLLRPSTVRGLRTFDETQRSIQGIFS